MSIALATQQPLRDLKKASDVEIATWIDLLDERHNQQKVR